MADGRTSNITITTNETLWVLSGDATARLWLIMQEEWGAITAAKAADLWRQWQETWKQWKSAPPKRAEYYSTGQDIPDAEENHR